VVVRGAVLPPDHLVVESRVTNIFLFLLVNGMVSRSTKFKKNVKVRRTNQPIKSIYKKHAVAKKRPTLTKVNQSAITTLARQVKSLQLNRFGDRQYQYQVARMVPSSVPGTGPTLRSPVFFCASSFFNSEPCYQGTVNAAGAANYQQVGTSPANEVRFRKPTFDVDIQKQYQWVEQQAGKNTISRIEYLPLYMNHKISISGLISSRDQPLRYRFTMFKTKKQPVPSNIKNFGMPQAGGAYWFMCADDYNQRNKFSKSFHTVLMDKWVVINPPCINYENTPAGPSPELTQCPIRRVVNMNYTFKTNKPYKPNLFNDPANQLFWTNVEEDDIIWIMISSNIDVNSATQGIQPTIQIERSLGWRDTQGTTPNMGP